MQSVFDVHSNRKDDPVFTKFKIIPITHNRFHLFIVNQMAKSEKKCEKLSGPSMFHEGKQQPDSAGQTSDHYCDNLTKSGDFVALERTAPVERHEQGL